MSAPCAEPSAQNLGAFEVPGLALLQLDDNDTITAASAEYCRLLGRAAHEVIGHNPCDFTHPDDLEVSRRSLTATREHPANFSKRYLRPDGTVVPVRLSSIWLPALGRTVTHVADLTPTIANQTALLRARSHHEALIEHSTDLIFVLDIDQRLVEANPATIDLVGNRVGEPAEVILRDLVHPDDLAGALQSLIDVGEGSGPHEPVRLRVAAPDARWKHLEVVANNQLENPAVLGIVVNARDVSDAVKGLERVEATLRSLIGALGRATEYRDPYTAGHQSQVADLSRRIARHLDIPPRQCETIGLGASVHDIGKIGIPAEILTRPGKLSALEFDLVRTHCRVGQQILADVDLPWEIPDIVLHHHERLDGSGYPDGLADDSISLAAKIVAVADVIDAMASHRPYRAALGMDAARAEIRRGRGTRYDPAASDAALDLTSTHKVRRPKTGFASGHDEA